jgi:hypothetical protein
VNVEHIALHHLRMPLVAPFETSFGREVERECILIVLQAGGLTGYGECVASRDPGYNYETTGTAWHILKDFVAPLVLGHDLKNAADFQNAVLPIRGHHLAKAGVEMAPEDLDLLVLSQHGLGKRTPLSDYRVIRRGGQGVKTLDITKRTGQVVDCKVVAPDDGVLVITHEGQIIRQKVGEIRRTGRVAQGVIIIRLDQGDRVAGLTRVVSHEEQEP